MNFKKFKECCQTCEHKDHCDVKLFNLCFQNTENMEELLGLEEE